MLPTKTLNPAFVQSGDTKLNSKRSQPLNPGESTSGHADHWWWIGVILTVAGLVGYTCVRLELGVESSSLTNTTSVNGTQTRKVKTGNNTTEIDGAVGLE